MGEPSERDRRVTVGGRSRASWVSTKRCGGGDVAGQEECLRSKVGGICSNARLKRKRRVSVRFPTAPSGYSNRRRETSAIKSQNKAACLQPMVEHHGVPPAARRQPPRRGRQRSGSGGRQGGHVEVPLEGAVQGADKIHCSRPVRKRRMGRFGREARNGGKAERERHRASLRQGAREPFPPRVRPRATGAPSPFSSSIPSMLSTDQSPEVSWPRSAPAPLRTGEET